MILRHTKLVRWVIYQNVSQPIESKRFVRYKKINNTNERRHWRGTDVPGSVLSTLSAVAQGINAEADCRCLLMVFDGVYRDKR